MKKITIIKNKKQYQTYCNYLEKLVEEGKDTDSIELITLLIETWDEEHNTLGDADPVVLLKSLMLEHQLKPVELAQILELSKSTVSKILNYQNGLSKETIRKLSAYFKVSQEAFNQPYELKNEINKYFKEASLMNTKKKIFSLK